MISSKVLHRRKACEKKLVENQKQNRLHYLLPLYYIDVYYLDAAKKKITEVFFRARTFLFFRVFWLEEAT